MKLNVPEAILITQCDGGKWHRILLHDADVYYSRVLQIHQYPTHLCTYHHTACQ